MIVGVIFKNEAVLWSTSRVGRTASRRSCRRGPRGALRAASLQTGRNQLWLRARGEVRCRGANEWRREATGPFQIPTTQTITYLLKRFATWLELPLYDGKPWHWSTHQDVKHLHVLSRFGTGHRCWPGSTSGTPRTRHHRSRLRRH